MPKGTDTLQARIQRAGILAQEGGATMARIQTQLKAQFGMGLAPKVLGPILTAARNGAAHKAHLESHKKALEETKLLGVQVGEPNGKPDAKRRGRKVKYVLVASFAGELRGFKNRDELLDAIMDGAGVPTQIFSASE